MAAASTRVVFLLVKCLKLSISGFHFHFRSSCPDIFGFSEVADGHFVVVLAWLVADLHAAAL